MIRAFIGVIGSGKDYSAKKLVAGGGWVALNFADPLREKAWLLLGWAPQNDRDYDWFKKLPIDLCYEIGEKDDFELALLEQLTKSRAPKGRVFLQLLGTEVLRDADKHYFGKKWQERAHQHLKAGLNIAVTDARFFNEIESLLEVDSKTEFVFCNYKSHRYEPANSHESERLAQTLLKHGFENGDVLPIKSRLDLMPYLEESD